jgi:vacuolar protein sorting-associated protein 52
MESILYQFQSDLSNISDEIRSLQDQSSTMSVKLQNRKVR